MNISSVHLENVRIVLKFYFCELIYHISVLRFGRFIESLYASLPLLDDKKPSVRYFLVLSKIANSLFLLADHILWLGRADICSVNTEKCSEISNKYWLFSITMSLVRDVCEISQIDFKTLVQQNDIRKAPDFLTKIAKGMKVAQANVFVDTLRNSCDFFIPLTALGYVKLSPGTVGLLGTISSLLGLWVIISPKLKLSPS